MTIELPPLPYPLDGLEPHLSAETLQFHYGKHHRTYVTKLNELIEGTEHADSSLDEIIAAAEPGPLFNNAAQTWNHSFYWNSMSPSGGGVPSGDVAQAIDAAFGTHKQFREQFAKAAIALFGSGYAWLVEERGALSIVTTPDADLPGRHGQRALLNLDVWEHAYYIDFRNDRAEYVEVFLDSLVNWDFVAANLAT